MSTTPPVAAPGVPLHDMGRNAQVHGLRGVLAFAVFVFHVANSGLPTFDGSWMSPLEQFLISLEHGVELFFGISGIVIVVAWRKSRRPAAFVWNRATRIFPVLWVTIAVIAALSMLEPQKRVPVDPVNLVASLFALWPLLPFRPVHPAAWSISYEFAFYGLFVVAALLSRRFPARVAIAVVALLGAALVATHVRGACFVIGVGVALGWFDRAIHWGGARYAGLWLLAALLSWRLAFSAAGFEIAHETNVATLAAEPAAAAWFTIALLCATLGLAGIVGGAGWFCAALRTPLLQWLGTISYSLYLWQTITMAITKKLMVMAGLPAFAGEWSQVAFFFAALGPTLLVSHLSQRVLEDAVTRRLRHVWQRPRKSAVLATEMRHGS